VVGSCLGKIFAKKTGWGGYYLKLGKNNKKVGVGGGGVFEGNGGSFLGDAGFGDLKSQGCGGLFGVPFGGCQTRFLLVERGGVFHHHCREAHTKAREEGKCKCARKKSEIERSEKKGRGLEGHSARMGDNEVITDPKELRGAL